MMTSPSLPGGGSWLIGETVTDHLRQRLFAAAYRADGLEALLNEVNAVLGARGVAVHLLDSSSFQLVGHSEMAVVPMAGCVGAERCDCFSALLTEVREAGFRPRSRELPPLEQCRFHDSGVEVVTLVVIRSDELVRGAIEVFWAVAPTEDQVEAVAAVGNVVDAIVDQEHQERMIDRARRDLALLLHRQSRTLEERQHQLQADMARAIRLDAALRGVLEQLTLGIVLIQDEQVLYINEAHCRLLGRSRDELIGASVGALAALVHPDERPELLRRFQRWIVGQGGEPTIWRVQRDGEEQSRWLEVTATVIDFLDRPALIAASVDVTERVLIEQDLRHSEATARALLDNPSYAAALLDREGRVLDANDETAARLNRPVEEVIGRSCFDLFPPEVAQKRWEHVQRVVETGEPLRAEDERDGMVNDLFYHPLIDAEGRVTEITITAFDITARKEADVQLERSREELRQLSLGLQRAIEDERARIALEIHDELGQTLTAVKMDVAWAEEHLGDEDGVSERLRAALGLIEQMTASVRRIGTELCPSILDHLGLSAAIEWQVGELERRTDLRFQVSLPEVEPTLSSETSIGLFRFLQEVLTNIVRHARAEVVEVRFDVTEDELRLEVSDDGVGFDLSRPRPHSSLGLLGARERVNSLGGGLEIESAPGEGTTIAARVPRTSPGGAR